MQKYLQQRETVGEAADEEEEEEQQQEEQEEEQQEYTEDSGGESGDDKCILSHADFHCHNYLFTVAIFIEY